MTIELVRSYGFEILPREQFMARRGPLIDKLILRSIENNLTHHEFVLFDLDSDDQGFMIWGDNKNELADEAISFFELEPKIGQLS